MATGLFKVTVVQHWLRNTWINPQGQPCDAAHPGRGSSRPGR